VKRNLYRQEEMVSLFVLTMKVMDGNQQNIKIGDQEKIK